ncbi:hypothetical protein [Lactiplantibacillus daowaiensis]|uniref:Integral membrane protein n=1 Tax=Lactiplantibacillus daowaiensis TaxID=2559918 RepID=A0ABW1S4Z5_9LACO|nr:hypothetical protein [Lactiplantibacillus daowaiensis]
MLKKRWFRYLLDNVVTCFVIALIDFQHPLPLRTYLWTIPIGLAGYYLTDGLKWLGRRYGDWLDRHFSK